MTTTAARRVAAVVWGTCAMIALGTLVLLVMGIGRSTPGDASGVGGWGGLSYVPLSLTFGTVGALVLARLPGNRVGWVMCVTGLAIGVGDLTYQYADQALYGSATSLPGGVVAAWIQSFALSPAFGLVALALLVFPDGRLPSRRWWPALVLALAGSVLLVIGYAFRPGPLDPPFGTVDNPLGVTGSFTAMDGLAGLGWIFTGPGVALAAAALRIRLRRARGQERQQLKWVTLAVTVAGTIVLVDVATFFLSVAGINQVRDAALGLALMTIPAAIGIAITRYRLYDIDVVINRTLVYASLTASLATIYLGSVLLLQLALSAFTAGSSLAIAVSTLAVAAAFRPVRARIQHGVDHRFFRAKYDATRTLERFSTHLRDQVDLADIGTDLLSVVNETVQPSHVSLWLRTPELHA